MAKRKGNWKPKSKEEKQEELDQLIELSNQKIEKYQSSPEEMLEFAKFMSKIHNYSPLNLSLIDEQFRGAIAVASYASWNKLGFNVQKGEKGIGIYTHAPVTVFTGKDGKEKTLREATSEEKALINNGSIHTKQVKHFKKGYVYDVSQTNATGEDLPKIFPNRVWNFDLEGQNSIEQLENGIFNLSSSMGIDIKDMRETFYGEIGSARGAYVRYVSGREEILLNSRNSRTQNIATSIHELAHKKLHNQSEEGANYPTEIKELQAEMTSFIVCHNYGLDTSEKAIPYMASWTENNNKIEPKMFRQVMTEVKETAVGFIDKIDESILLDRLELENNQHLNVAKEATQTLEQTKQSAQKQGEGQTALKNTFTAEQSKEREPEQLIFRNQLFSGDDFKRFSNDNFDNIRFENCTFEKILMTNSSFKNTVFSDCKFKFVDLSNSDFSDSTIYSTEFSSGSLKNSNFENATIRSTRFKGTNLSNVDFLTSKFENVSFDDVKIGKSIRHLETTSMYVRGGTSEECERYKENVLNQLEKENFNDSFEVDKMDLEYRDYYDATINDPNRLIHGSYLESMVHYYQDKDGGKAIELDSHGETVTATVGKNYVSYYLDTKQFDLCDLYGVTAENTSVDEYDRLLLDRSPDNCNYVEAFLRESIKAYEKYEGIQISEELSELQSEPIYAKPLRTIVMDESIHNLSISPAYYNSLSSWHDEFVNQSDLESVGDLNNIGSIDEFYHTHKQEIENKIDDLVEVTKIDVRQGLGEEEYKDQMATTAYRLTAISLKNELETGDFEIPEGEMLVNQFQEMELG